MKLDLGARVEGYVITEVMHENAWHILYGGKKVLEHFDFAAQKRRESERHEWLDVCLRTLKYPHPQDAADVKLRRRMAKLEIQRVYGHGQSRLWPEPVDLFDVENTHDPFADPATRQGEPILVFARPHGLSLEAWQQSLLPLTSILSVLAELLDFMHLTHDQGILLQCLHPEHLLVDRAGRVHNLAGDLALDLKHLQTEADKTPPSWRRLFPDDRFPDGFAAPEMYGNPRRIDRRTDLYSWGAVAMWLLAGVSPAQLAHEAKQRSATFLGEHFEQLRRYLADTPPAYIRDWAEQLDLPAADLTADWPANVVALMGRLLAPEPRRRPDNVLTLKKWLVRAPAEPIEKMVALFQGQGEVKLRLRLPSFLPPDAVLEIRRQVKQPAQRPDEGTLLYEGPVEPEFLDKDMPLTDQKIYYTAFVRRGSGPWAVYSEGVDATVMEMAKVGRDDSFTRERKELLDRLFVYPVDPQALPKLEALARDRYESEAEGRLVKWLCRRLKALPAEKRPAASALLADVLVWHQAIERLLPSLAGRAQSDLYHVVASGLLLDIGLRLRPPVPPALLPHLQPLLGMKVIPLDYRRRLLALLWQTSGTDGPMALDLLRAYIQKAGKIKAIEQLRDFEQLVGTGPALTALIGELHDQLRMTCPRCSLVLPRQIMVEHLWNEHRLLLHGDQARDPWSIIYEWLLEYRQTGNPAVWHQATQLAQQTDPELGMMKVQRMWDVESRNS